jgi:hypothetical protein
MTTIQAPIRLSTRFLSTPAPKNDTASGLADVVHLTSRPPRLRGAQPSSVRCDVSCRMPIMVAAGVPVIMTDRVKADVPPAMVAFLRRPVALVVRPNVSHEVPIAMTAAVRLVVDPGMDAAMLRSRVVRGSRDGKPAANDHRRREQKGREEPHSHFGKHDSSPLTLPTPASSDPMRADHFFLFFNADPTPRHSTRRAITASLPE